MTPFDPSDKPIYQVLEPCEASWQDVDWLTYESTDGAFKRIVYAAPLHDAIEGAMQQGFDAGKFFGEISVNPSAEPVAFMHTLQMEGGQTDERLAFDKFNPWGVPGLDYDDSYSVTIDPLYLAAPLAEQDRIDAERIRQAKLEAYESVLALSDTHITNDRLLNAVQAAIDLLKGASK